MNRIIQSTSILSTLLLLIAALFFSGNIVSAKIAVSHGTDPFVILGARNLSLTIFSILLLGGLARAFQQLHTHRLFSNKTLWILGTLIGFQGCALYAGLQFLPVFLASVLFNLHPFIALIIQRILFKRSINPLEFLGFALLTISLMLTLDVFGTSLTWNADTLIGVTLILMGATSFASMIMLIQHSKIIDIEPKVRTFSTMCVGTLFAFAALLSTQSFGFSPTGHQLPQDHIGWIALILACLCYAGAMLTMLTILPKYAKKSTSNTVILSTEPVMVLALSASLMNQHIFPHQILGAVLACLCVALLAYGTHLHSTQVLLKS